MKILAIVGEAGTGKDTLLRETVARFPGKFHEIVSCTTRPRREGEVNGKSYYFLTIDQFTDKINRGEMLEYTSFNGWMYGTSKSSLSADKINIGVFNPAGIYSISKFISPEDLIVVRINCDKKERLVRQIYREANPDIDEIVRRYGTDKHDFELFDAWPYDKMILDNSKPLYLVRNVEAIGQKC